MRTAPDTADEYTAELRRVNSNLLMMIGYLEQMIADAVKSVLQRDTELAKRTIETDHNVNRLEIDTDQLCLSILARHRLGDRYLRFIALAMKMVTDLERIEDLTVNISERALALDARQRGSKRHGRPSRASRGGSTPASGRQVLGANWRSSS